VTDDCSVLNFAIDRHRRYHFTGPKGLANEGNAVWIYDATRIGVGWIIWTPDVDLRSAYGEGRLV